MKTKTLKKLRADSGKSMLDIEREGMITRQTLMNLEKGKNAFVTSLLALCEVYDVTGHEILSAWLESKRQAEIEKS